MKTINIEEKFGLFDDHWSPRIIAALNGQQVKLAKLKGELVWHSHAGEDELFLVVKGTLHMKFRDREISAGEGEIIVVPRGVEHFPYTADDEEVWVMLFEPSETRETPS
ncbi:MAG: cupin domain-containing protein [Cyclobacteriaceae bacterium]